MCVVTGGAVQFRCVCVCVRLGVILCWIWMLCHCDVVVVACVVVVGSCMCTPPLRRSPCASHSNSRLCSSPPRVGEQSERARTHTCCSLQSAVVIYSPSVCLSVLAVLVCGPSAALWQHLVPPTDVGRFCSSISLCVVAVACISLPLCIRDAMFRSPRSELHTNNPTCRNNPTCEHVSMRGSMRQVVGCTAKLQSCNNQRHQQQDTRATQNKRANTPTTHPGSRCQPRASLTETNSSSDHHHHHHHSTPPTVLRPQCRPSQVQRRPPEPLAAVPHCTQMPGGARCQPTSQPGRCAHAAAAHQC